MTPDETATSTTPGVGPDGASGGAGAAGGRTADGDRASGASVGGGNAGSGAASGGSVGGGPAGGSTAGGTTDAGTQRSTAARVGAAVGRAAGTAAKGTRQVIRKNPTADKVYRTSVGVVGGTTVALGVALIPLPGPGSLIAVGGLALLGTEFKTAKKVSTKANALAKKAYVKARDARAQKKAERDTSV